MKFRTELEIPTAPFRIDYRSRILAVGSCFASSVAQKLRRAKFHVAENPFGEMFNPVSVAECLGRLNDARPFATDEFNEGINGWFSYSLHGSFDTSDREEALHKANVALEGGAQALTAADTLIVTLGTAWVYSLAREGCVVANCHKQPSTTFCRSRLSVDECKAALRPLFDGAFRNKRIVLTVSPVRHLGDGLIENSLSKALLRVAAAELQAECPNVWYFGAYELLQDDLRDYRFYADDMVHPSAQAVDYVWQKFCGATMDASVREAVGRFEKLSDALAHRPLHPESREYAAFRASLLNQIETLRKEFPTAALDEL